MPKYDQQSLEELLRLAARGHGSGYSGVAKGGGGGYGEGYTPPTFSLLTLPRVAILGPSTARRNNISFTTGASRSLANMCSGPIIWARAFSKMFKFYNKRDAAADPTRGYIGDNYGFDSLAIADQILLIPSILASTANYRIIIWNTGRGVDDVFPGQTVNGYCAPVEAALLTLKASGKVIVWENLWPRDSTAAGGNWAQGQSNRQLLVDINARLQAFCTAQGIRWVDMYSIMCGTSTQAAATDPLPNYFTNDGIHIANQGGYMAGRNLYSPLFATLCTTPAEYNILDAANIAPNPGLSGTAGTLLNTATGTVPDGWAAGRNGGSNARSLVISSEDVGGKHWVVFTVGSSGTVTANGEGLTIRRATSPVVTFWDTSKFYQARLTVKVDGWIGWTFFTFYLQDGATPQQGMRDLVGISGTDGDVPVSDSAATQYTTIPVDQDTFVCETPPFKPTHTSCEMRFTAGYLNRTGGGVIKIANWDIREVPDPGL